MSSRLIVAIGKTKDIAPFVGQIHDNLFNLHRSNMFNVKSINRSFHDVVPVRSIHNRDVIL